jgi:hypothetical protein
MGKLEVVTYAFQFQMAPLTDITVNVKRAVTIEEINNAKCCSK